MTTYYVGPGGSNSNNGTSWALRKLTLNGAEDIPVAAGDTVWVGPGAYRELLTCDVSGSSGSPITYIGDVTGEHTDGVGGTVRITGSDNDTTTTRASCITASIRDYRTFRGFVMDMTTGDIVIATECDYWTIEDCQFDVVTSTKFAVAVTNTSTGVTIRRCLFYIHNGGYGVKFSHTATFDNSANTVENCIFDGGNQAFTVSRVGGVIIRNCLFRYSWAYTIRVDQALTVGQVLTVINNIFYLCGTCMRSTTADEIYNSYNTFFACATLRQTTGDSGNNLAYPPLFAQNTMLAGARFPQPILGQLSEWSPIKAVAGTDMASGDFYGITRPATDSKKSWGPVQYVEPRRDTATKRTGAASLKLPDAGRHQMFVPTANASTVFSCYVYWGADYAGTKPSITIKQPGQSDTTVTATGSAESWELLTTTLTPAASPGYCVVELVSSNTATSGSYATYFDDLTVT